MKDPGDPVYKGITLTAWLALGLILFIGAALVLPALFSSGRASNDQRPWAILKCLSCAEADFRTNDRDWNHVNDYWTGDVKGLYTMTSCAVRGATGDSSDPPIKLISLQFAASDADETLIDAGGENFDLLKVTVPSPYRGYWHAALLHDRSDPKDPEYKQDTGGSPDMGKCHHRSKFGFVSFPDSTSAGPFVIIINERDSIYRSAVTTGTRTTRSIPPGLKNLLPVYLEWPDEKTLRTYWSKLD